MLAPDVVTLVAHVPENEFNLGVQDSFVNAPYLRGEKLYGEDLSEKIVRSAEESSRYQVA